jgi:methyl-accepting chemotaxis protein
MEELRSVAEQIADGAQAVNDAATHTQGDVQAGLRAVAETVRRMAEIRASNQASVDEILGLGEKAHQINSVMDLIDDIAAQTRLIAINASIESAAAGEAGKRFGVVASQVRHLAENVAQSTDEIRQRIREIQVATNELVIAAEQGTKKIEQGVDLSQTTQRALDQIAQSAEQTSLSAGQISISTRQQQTAVEQVVTAHVVADLGKWTDTLNDLVALFDLGQEDE